MSSKNKVTEWRASVSEEKRRLMREADKERKAKKRASMTEEEKNAVKEKDRLRKAMKKTSQVDGRTLPRERPWLDNRPVYDEAAANREYKRRVKESMTEEEQEFQKIQNLLIKRKSRAKRTSERKEEDKARAKEGMKIIKEKGNIMKFKARRTKGDGEEDLWWKFWKKGNENREILLNKLPEIAAKFQEWETAGKGPSDGPDLNITDEGKRMRKYLRDMLM